MTRYFLGVDIGSTKSHALIATEYGEVVGFGTGGAGNHESQGLDGFQRTLHTVVNAALKDSRLSKTDIVGMGYGIAGYDWPSDRPLMNRVIDTLGINAPYDAVNDSLMGLIAGSKHGWGVGVTSGTSCNCRGRDKSGREGRVTGNGSLFGEYGGGGEIVHRCMDVISRAWSLRGPETLLSELFVRHLGAKNVEDMLEGIARGRYRVQATDAPVFFEALAKGDAVAGRLLEWISRELGNLAIGVIRQLQFEALEFEVVLAGSFFKGSPKIAEYMRDEIHQVAPGAALVRLEAPPVVGPALLGMEAAGVDFTAVRERLIEATLRFTASIEQT